MIAPAAPGLVGAACMACGGRSLVIHFRVAGVPGPEGLAPTTSRFGTALSDVVRCADCGHMQLAELPSQAELSAAYAQTAGDDYFDEQEGQRRTAAALLDRLERHAQVGALLDVGCWFGFVSDEARRRGWVVSGLEPSQAASEYARRVLGLDVRTGDLFDCELEPAAYDAVLMADVLEHLPDPGAALDRIAGAIRPDGVLLLTLPDAGSRLARVLGRRWWSVIPTHVQYFTRRSLGTLLGRHGWEIVELATAPKAFSVRYYLERATGYSEALARSAVRLAALASVADRVWTPDFRDRVCVLAKLTREPSGAARGFRRRHAG